jgi:NADH-quinone oxidoreductase subunit N
MMQILPLLIIWITASLILLGDVWWWKNRKEYNPALAIGGVLIALALYLKQLRMDGVTNEAYFGGCILVDGKAVVSGIALLVTALLSILMAWTYLRQHGMDHGEYYVLLLLSVSGAMLMAHANDLIVVFLGLEVLSFALYVLAGFARKEAKSEEASIKYFLLGAFASAFLLYGIALMYGATKTTNLDGMVRILAHDKIQTPMVLGGIALLIVGFGFKAAVIPFHQWTPDVYEGSPTSVTAFMAGAAKIGAFVAFLRVFDRLNLLSAFWLPAIQIIAILTMVAGNVMAVTQTNLKRLLAYSSIAHAGYLLVAVASLAQPGRVFRIGQTTVGDLAMTGAMFYLFAYIFMTLGAFGVLIYLGSRGKEYEQITDLRGLARSNPFAAYTMMFFMLSLGGIPPTMGFMGKWQIFIAAVGGGKILLAVVLALSSVMAVFYYLRVVYMMTFEEPIGETPALETVDKSSGAYVSVVLAVVATVLFGVLPGLLTTLTMMAK